MAATASYRAVPSMLTVAPIGATNLATRMSTRFLISRHSMVTGNVAELFHTKKEKKKKHYKSLLRIEKENMYI